MLEPVEKNNFLDGRGKQYYLLKTGQKEIEAGREENICSCTAIY